MSSVQGPMPGLRPRAPAPGPTVAVRLPAGAVDVARAPPPGGAVYMPRNWALTAAGVLLVLVLIGGLIWLIVWLATRGGGGGGGGGNANVPYPPWNPGSVASTPVTIRNPTGSYFVYADKGQLRLTRAFGDGWVWRLRDTDGMFILQLETKNGTPSYVAVNSRGSVTIVPTETKATAFRGYLVDADKQEVIFGTDVAKPLFLTATSNNAITTTPRADRALRVVVAPAAPVVQARPMVDYGQSARAAPQGAAMSFAAPAPAPPAPAPAPTVRLSAAASGYTFPPMSQDMYS